MSTRTLPISLEIVKHANPKTIRKIVYQECAPQTSDIVEMVRGSRSEVVEVLKELEEIGDIESYYVTDEPHWLPIYRSEPDPEPEPTPNEIEGLATTIIANSDVFISPDSVERLEDWR